MWLARTGVRSNTHPPTPIDLQSTTVWRALSSSSRWAAARLSSMLLIQSRGGWCASSLHGFGVQYGHCWTLADGVHAIGHITPSPPSVLPKLQAYQYPLILPDPAAEALAQLRAGAPLQHEGFHTQLGNAEAHAHTPRSCLGSASVLACMKAAPCMSCMQAGASSSVAASRSGHRTPFSTSPSQPWTSLRAPSSMPKSFHPLLDEESLNVSGQHHHKLSRDVLIAIGSVHNAHKAPWMKVTLLWHRTLQPDKRHGAWGPRTSRPPTRCAAPAARTSPLQISTSSPCRPLPPP